MLKTNVVDKNNFVYNDIKPFLKVTCANCESHTMYSDLNNVFEKYNTSKLYKLDGFNSGKNKEEGKEEN